MSRANVPEDVEINGAMLEAHVKAFRLFPELATAQLLEQGIGRAGKGEEAMLFDGWYPMKAWLLAFDALLAKVGPSKLFEIGRRVPEHARLPPTIQDVHSALGAIDVGYHMNHRRAGRVMFDPQTGSMLEGIGHYRIEPFAGGRTLRSTCDSCYPCDFDRGIYFAFARMTEPRAAVEHAAGPCRRTGGASCAYVVTW